MHSGRTLALTPEDPEPQEPVSCHCPLRATAARGEVLSGSAAPYGRALPPARGRPGSARRGRNKTERGTPPHRRVAQPARAQSTKTATPADRLPREAMAIGTKLAIWLLRWRPELRRPLPQL